MQASLDNNRRTKWPHRLAVALTCATFPLIWVGGLVTTYDAGMSVPDWPTTYGYNLFLYPVTTWLAAPWDLFIEHGHRLLGSLVGLITMGLLYTTWRHEDRIWLRWAALAALALVIFQGILGGQRVVRNSRQIAQLHGIVGPAFFALALFLAAATSKWWRSASTKPDNVSDFVLSGWILAGLAFLQLYLGSQLRHVDSFTPLGTFSAFVTFHIAVAMVLVCVTLSVSVSALRELRDLTMRRIAGFMGLLVLTQLALGTGTWIAKYGWPAIFASWGIEAAIVVQAESMVQAMVTTAHVAVGSLILATSCLWAASVTRYSIVIPQRSSSHAARHHDASVGSGNSSCDRELVTGGAA